MILHEFLEAWVSVPVHPVHCSCGVRGLFFCAAFFLMAGSGERACAQPPNDAMIRITLPDEVEVKGLVDYVSERLAIRILYDETIANKKINLRAPGEIPASSLLSLLQSALRMKGLVLVDADAPGWKKIVEETRLPEVSLADDPVAVVDRAGGATAVTQAFVLNHIDPTQLETTIKPFLSTGANSIALKAQRVLIITDYASNLVKLARLIELIDRARPNAVTELLSLEHTDAAMISEQINSILEARASPGGTAQPQQRAVTVFPDARTNRLIVVGDAAEVEELGTLVQALDVPLGLTTDVYLLRHIAADRFDRLAGNLVDPHDRQRLYQSVVDVQENLLVVTAPAEIHARIKQLAARLDVPGATEGRSRIGFYKLKHITATDALETLQSIENSSQIQPARIDAAPRTDGRFRLNDPQRPPQGNRPQLRPMEVLPEPPAFRETTEDTGEHPPLLSPSPDQLGHPGGLPGNASVTADINANMLIVVADPVVQQLYAELIEALDRPRPQVMIEARIVILDTSDDFALGIEASGGDRLGDKRLLAFSSFGLSEVDPVSGALSIIPGLGFNGTLVDPEVADVILRAFTRHRRAKVVSAPRLLVNDNATGTLSSVTEIPFTSVNASQTVATTSFAGFADAGTTIMVTPHISENGRLQLDYRITLNDFQGSPSAEGVPPPRQTDEIESQVTIPDGHTLIVGGLNRKRASHTIDSLPFLERIPLLKYVVSNQTQNHAQTSLFVFLRPVILRDDKFRDLKYLSERDIARAGTKGDAPKSVPLLIP